MRATLGLRATLLIAAAAAAGLPAAAQSYREVCADVRGDKQVAGAVLGGVVGGLLGNGVAARNTKEEGAVLGALVGAIAGSQIGRGDVDCNPRVYDGYIGDRGLPIVRADDYRYQTTPYGQTPYGYSPYGQTAYGQTPYGQTPYGYSPGHSYPHPGAYQAARSTGRRNKHPHQGLADRDGRDYRYEDDFAGRECADARRITRLPDGREIHEPIEACRYAYYGDWDVRD